MSGAAGSPVPARSLPWQARHPPTVARYSPYSTVTPGTGGAGRASWSAKDAFAAYRWTLQNANSLNGDRARVAVAGESAGGNLAAAVSMMARDSSVRLPVYQVLVYPIARYGWDTESYQENANAVPLGKADMKWFFDHYLGSPADGRSPLISLVDAKNLGRLPSATVITAEIDPLRSEGRMYADRLRKAGVEVDYRNYEGVSHELFGMAAVVDKAKQAVQQAGAGLKRAFSASASASREARR